MRIVAMTNDGQLPMMKNMLNSALKAGWPMHLFHCYLIGTNKESASYNTLEFQSLTLRKLEIILENMRQEREVIWIDNDIVLFKNTIDHMRSFPGQFIMQDDLWGPCTGFFLVRTNLTSIRVMEKTIAYLKEKLTTTVLNDQHAFCRIIKQPIIGLVLSLLPQNEYPNGEIYFTKGIKQDAKMVHNNYLTSTREKVDRFKEFNLWDDADTAFLLTNRYSI
jgi:hypothetical protein